MYKTYCEVRDRKGLKDADVAKGTGLNAQLFSDWKRGKGAPKAEKLLKIADFLEVPMEYLITGEMPTKGGYFLDEEAARLAQEYQADQNIRIIFDGVRKSSKEDILFIKELVERMGLND